MALNTVISMIFIISVIKIWGTKKWSPGARIGLIFIALLVWLVSFMARPIAYFFIGMGIVAFVVSVMIPSNEGDAQNNNAKSDTPTPWKAYENDKNDRQN